MWPFSLRNMNYTFLKLVTFFLISEISCGESDSDNPIVSTIYGKVRGVKTKNHYEFRKIPFARPPVGSLRFKPPLEPEPWTEVLETDKEFPEFCIQYNVFWNKTEGVEDCLYLNVFTPNISPDQKKLPVMVYIHSGGFMFGRGAQFRGDYLMETKKVVAVVFQYRLGSFGFLNTEDEHSFGNMGLKDQTLALKWVKSSIEVFGGDSNNVMIFGTSAGAASVHYHILSPLSSGLFHRAFSGSGTALCPWAFQRRPRGNALRLGELLGCPTKDSSSLVSCLRTKDAHEIGFAHSKFLEWYADPIAAFGPSLEVGNPDASSHFISQAPADIIESGVVNEVPWILLFNSDEGYEHSMSIFKNDKLLTELNSKWERIFPITLEYVHESQEDKDRISREVREFYLNNRPVCGENLKNLSNAYSDKTYVLCTLKTAYRHGKLDKSQTHPIYLVQFHYKGENSIVTLKGYSNEGFGTNHMDDIQYLTNSPLFRFLDEDSKDKPFQKAYAEMITTFAATGIVPPFSKDYPDELMQPLDPGGNIKWYRVSSHPQMEPMTHDISKRMNFWNQFHLQEYQISSKEYQPKDEL